jgi:hypothetical protein
MFSGERKSGKLNIYHSGTDPKDRSVVSAVRIVLIRNKARVLQNPDTIFSLCVMGSGSLSFKNTVRKLVISKLS